MVSESVFDFLHSGVSEIADDVTCENCIQKEKETVGQENISNQVLFCRDFRTDEKDGKRSCQQKYQCPEGKSQEYIRNNVQQNCMSESGRCRLVSIENIRMIKWIFFHFAADSSGAPCPSVCDSSMCSFSDSAFLKFPGTTYFQNSTA